MIALGADHGGYEIKEAVKKYLEEKGIEYKDFGTYSTDSVDYPRYAYPVAKAVSSKECELGILCCGTRLDRHCPQFCVNRKLQDSGFILESCFQI